MYGGRRTPMGGGSGERPLQRGLGASANLWGVVVVTVAISGGFAGFATATTLQDYLRADKIRSLDATSLGGEVRPAFLPDGVRFYYQSYGLDQRPGDYVLVDPVAGTKHRLFSPQSLAVALSDASGAQIDGDRLPPRTLIDHETQAVFELPQGRFSCSLATPRCVKATVALEATLRPAAAPPWAVRSPDGKWDAFIWDHNVYIRPSQLSRDDAAARLPEPATEGGARFGAAMDDSLVPFLPTGQRADCDFGAPPGPVDTTAPRYQRPPAGSIALTHDGERLWSYGPRWKLGAEVATLDADHYRPTHGYFAWSPDSKRLLVRREDIRGVSVYPLYSSTSIKPVDHSYYYAAPGDVSIPQADYYVVDVATHRSTRINVAPTGAVLLPTGAEWSADSSQVYVLSADRGPKEVRLSVADAQTGRAAPIIKETSPTFVEMSNGGEANIVYIADKGADVIWFSERDGWGHLYRYSADGKLKNQIEAGAYSVAELVKVDDKAQQIYFTAWGKASGNPYDRRLFRVNFDGSGITSLSPEAGDHFVQAIPGADLFLDTLSSTTTPPVTIVRRGDGSKVMEVSRGTDAPLRAIGWRPAETFTVKARDGVTDLYGVMYKPSNFDPSRRYPIVTNLYPGPFTGSVGPEWRFQGPDNFFIQAEGRSKVTHGEGMGQSLAELGFIVIKLDALGTAHRSKAMQDYFYGNSIDNGLPDQVAAIKQLAQRFRWIDPDRVGIFGHSGGGYAAAAGMLRFPDTFKVGVSEAGNHDIRKYGWYWGEQYQGLLNSPAAAASYAKQANATYAANLKGKLLLMHGDMDCNNPPAETLGLVDALTKQQKRFDLIIIPEAGHQLPDYAMWAAWDYFVRNLRGEEPPAAFKPEHRRYDF